MLYVPAAPGVVEAPTEEADDVDVDIDIDVVPVPVAVFAEEVPMYGVEGEAMDVELGVDGVADDVPAIDDADDAEEADIMPPPCADTWAEGTCIVMWGGSPAMLAIRGASAAGP